MDLTDTERKLAEEIGFSQDVCILIKRETGKPLERAYGTDEHHLRIMADGISVLMSNNEVETFIRANQATLLSRGYRGFWSERSQENGLRQGDELIVLKTTDHTAIVELRRTDGANYDILTGDILQRLSQWEKMCRLTVVGASSDWVALEFETLPDDLCAFAKEVYEFCPDTIAQGIGLREEDDDPEFFAAARRLCPEPGEDSGVRLLANELQKTKYLFLWWD